MARKTTLDKLGDAVSRVLEEYRDDIRSNLDAITREMGRKGAQALRQQSAQALEKRTGKYAAGWKHEFRQTRRSAGTTIYNEHYSLPHLLEHGHVIRNGTGRTFGSVPAHPHIAPVAEQLMDAYEREVLSRL